MKRIILAALAALILPSLLAAAAPARSAGLAGAAGAGPAAGASSPAAVSGLATAPCVYQGLTTTQCRSLNPKVTFNADYFGDVTGCTFDWSISWGDGKVTRGIVQASPPDGYKYLAAHSYVKAGTFTLTVSGTVTGNCTLTPFKAKFTLLDYAALGDSYSAGVSAGDVIPPDRQPSGCGQSYNAYPDAVAAKIGESYKSAGEASSPFTFLACSGATMGDLATKQLPALTKNAKSIGLMTFSIGGNDLNFAGIMAACATQVYRLVGKTCEEAEGKSVKQDLSTFPARLEILFAKIAKEPYLAAGAPVVVVGYPEFFDPTWFLKDAAKHSCPTGFGVVTFPTTDMKWLNEVVSQIDKDLSTEAAAAGFKYANDLTAYGSGHYLCESDPDVNAALPHLNLVYSFHPKHSGQIAMATAVEKALGL